MDARMLCEEVLKWHAIVPAQRWSLSAERHANKWFRIDVHIFIQKVAFAWLVERLCAIDVKMSVARIVVSCTCCGSIKSRYQGIVYWVRCSGHCKESEVIFLSCFLCCILWIRQSILRPCFSFMESTFFCCNPLTTVLNLCREVNNLSG